LKVSYRGVFIVDFKWNLIRLAFGFVITKRYLLQNRLKGLFLAVLEQCELA
jgi:hypothetical protein